MRRLDAAGPNVSRVTVTHPLGRLVEDAARGVFPAADGGWTRLPAWAPGLSAVVSFTGHAYVIAPDAVTDAQLEGLGVNGLGGAHDPRVALSLAGPGGWVDSLDLVLTARGVGGHSSLVSRPDLADHPRARFARTLREDVRVFGLAGSSSTVVTLGRGIGGLPEVGVGIDAAPHGGGAGAELVRATLQLLEPGELVVAAVAPGNARSLRSFLAAGFTPLCSVQLIRRDRPASATPPAPAPRLGTSSG